jgi:hypothetical protein
MMMRMLDLGGASILVDDRRPADPDNPRGYYELEAVKGTARDASWTVEAPGRVVKVISWLLPHLPASHRYRCVFMHRKLDLVVRSQRAMLERLAANIPDSDEETRRTQAGHLAELGIWLETAKHIDALGVSYERVLAEPARQAARIARFLGLDLDTTKMTGAIEPNLQRQR